MDLQVICLHGIILALHFIIGGFATEVAVSRSKGLFDTFEVRINESSVCTEFNAVYSSNNQSTRGNWTRCKCREPEQVFYSVSSQEVPKCHPRSGNNIGCFHCINGCLSTIDWDYIYTMGWRSNSSLFDCEDSDGSYTLDVWNGQYWEQLARHDFDLKFLPRKLKLNSDVVFVWRNSTDSPTVKEYYKGILLRASIYCNSELLHCFLAKGTGVRNYVIKDFPDSETTANLKTRVDPQTSSQLTKNIVGIGAVVGGAFLLWLIVGILMCRNNHRPQPATLPPCQLESTHCQPNEEREYSQPSRPPTSTNPPLMLFDRSHQLLVYNYSHPEQTEDYQNITVAGNSGSIHEFHLQLEKM